MALLHALSETLTTHASLISNLSSFYRTLIDLDYLREEEVQFPPHTGQNKIPLATAALQRANLTLEAEQLLHLLPFITPASIWKLFSGEARITLDSKPLSYLSKEEGEEDSLDNARLIGYSDDGEVVLPAWAVQIFGANNRNENIVVYDTRTSNTTIVFFPRVVRRPSDQLTALLLPQRRSQSSQYTSPPSTSFQPQQRLLMLSLAPGLETYVRLYGFPGETTTSCGGCKR